MSAETLRSAVERRYAEAARATETALCCPVEYDAKRLEAIPDEVIEKDYGCGDPSRWIEPGETVLDLGSGAGKICFIASQVVGPKGRVIGIDMTDDMLEVARRNAPVVAENAGFSNVEFRKGRIQDLRLDLEAFAEAMRAAPPETAADYLAVEDIAAELRTKSPLVADASVNVVVSNCVLNLVEAADKPRLFAELHRVLKAGGRAVISDIVSDEPVPAAMQADPTLWSGCLSGALTEEGFARAFEEAGFRGVEFVKFESEPWRTVEGIEFRSVTVRAWKTESGPDLEGGQAAIYKGPFKEVRDEEGRRFPRGVRMAVSDETIRLLAQSPYAGQFALVGPSAPIGPDEEAPPYACGKDAVRHPRETKGFVADSDGGDGACGGGSCC